MFRLVRYHNGIHAAKKLVTERSDVARLAQPLVQLLASCVILVGTRRTRCAPYARRLKHKLDIDFAGAAKLVLADKSVAKLIGYSEKKVNVI